MEDVSPTRPSTDDRPVLLGCASSTAIGLANTILPAQRPKVSGVRKVPYRILSLDGGGVWALIQARALIELYSPATTGHQVLSDFDLAVANSGGSIVLGGLLEDLPLSAILGYFESEAQRRSIFQSTEKVLDGLIGGLAGFGPKYSAKKKLVGLSSLMPKSGGKSLSAATAGVARAGVDLHILITAFDFDRNVASFFRSAPAGGPDWGEGAESSATLAQAIHASSNAPVNYFDEPAYIGASRFWDGAVSGCNNPVLAGVTEAITLNIPRASIVALSLGTGTTRLPGPPSPQPASSLLACASPQGFPIDVAKIAGSITDDPPDVASFMAHVMMGGKEGVQAPADSRVVRLNPLISPVKNPRTDQWEPPARWSPIQFAYLATGIHLDALEQGDVDYISSYAQSWIAGDAPNQPIRMKVDTLEPELGQRTFSAARAAWEAIR